MNVLRRMRKSQALRFVPGANCAEARMARAYVSWTRSSASVASPVRYRARLCRPSMWARAACPSSGASQRRSARRPELVSPRARDAPARPGSVPASRDDSTTTPPARLFIMLPGAPATQSAERTFRDQHGWLAPWCGPTDQEADRIRHSHGPFAAQAFVHSLRRPEIRLIVQAVPRTSLGVRPTRFHPVHSYPLLASHGL